MKEKEKSVLEYEIIFEIFPYFGYYNEYQLYMPFMIKRHIYHDKFNY